MPVPAIDFEYGEDGKCVKLSSVKTLRDLAECVGVHYSTLIYFTNTGRDSHYVTFEVRKRSGAPRGIEAPVEVLKHIQRKVAEALSRIYRAPKPVHGLVSGRNIVSNATPHAGKRWVLNIDLRDFFPSIHFGRIRGVLIAQPYRLERKVATVIARICCYRNRLAQGAPSSPVLANMVARALDTKLRELARKHHITYTRYADDITFSGHSRTIPGSLAVFDGGTYRCSDTLVELVTATGFTLNPHKFRVQFGSMRKVVTGLVVNEHVNVRRRFVREIRAMLNAWRRYGYDAAQREYADRYWRTRTTKQKMAPSFKRVIRGKLEYLRHIKGETDVVVSMFKQLASLDAAPSLLRLVGEMEQRRRDRATKLERAVFVLESDGDCVQGTGFLVVGLGLVTCAHVARSDTRAFRADDPKTVHKLVVTHLDVHRDVAVLNFAEHETPPEDSLVPDGATLLGLGALVTLAGFAHYAPGASLSIKTAQVSQHRRWFDHSRFTVNTGIVFGMSGGPVLNESGQVVGIAATGAATNNMIDDPETQHGVIPWSEVMQSLAVAREAPQTA